MPGSTTNLTIPYPTSGDEPKASVVAAMVAAVDGQGQIWTAYTPTITQGVGVAYTKYNAGAKFTGKYCRFSMNFQPTNNGTAGQPVDILLPTALVPRYNTTVIGLGFFMETATGTMYTIELRSGSTTTMRVQDLGGDYTTQLVTSTRYVFWGQYELA